MTKIYYLDFLAYLFRFFILSPTQTILFYCHHMIGGFVMNGNLLFSSFLRFRR